MRRIAILGTGFVQWGGGIDFLRTVVNALTATNFDSELELVLVVPGQSLARTLRTIASGWKRRILYGASGPRFDSQPAGQSVADVLVAEEDSVLPTLQYDGTINSLARVLRRAGITSVIPAGATLGSDFPIPWVGYVPDFQHKYYPSFFARHEIYTRNRRFAAMLSSARAVIVNARTVQEDVSRYFPNSTARIFALPFAPTPLPAQATRGYDMVKKMFGLPERYFLISNQFWIHKAHRTAFEALARLRRELPNDDLHIVCTGNTYDYRFPNYFESLRTLVENLGLSEKIHFLGYIDKLDQLRIMAKAVAVIQPSLFEGGPGGGAVYDAVAAGVPAIVSNIGVNLEIGDEENVVFFEARSCDDLALKMKSIAGSVRSCESLVSKTRMRTRLAYAGQILLAAIDHASREQWRR